MASPPMQELQERLEKAREELKNLEQLIQAGDIDPRVLRDFREAVDHIRLTAWAVQKAIEHRGEPGGDLYLLPLLTNERIRRATRLNNDLMAALDPNDAASQTEAIGELFASVEQLYNHLAPRLGRSRKKS